MAGHYYSEGNSQESILSEAIGSAVRINMRTDRRHLKLASILGFVEPPCKLNQIIFLHNSRGKPVGYATWALVDEDTNLRLHSSSEPLLSLGDWNSGAHLWLMDVVCPLGGCRAILKNARRRLISDVKLVSWTRRRLTSSGITLISHSIWLDRPPLDAG